MERITDKYAKEFEIFEKQRKEIRRLWNISEATGLFLHRLVEISMPKRILELGTSNGYSTFWFSISCGKYGGIVESVEVDEKRYKMAQENLKNRENITLVNGLIDEVIPKLNGNYDMVFIDANKSDYIKYIKLLLKHQKLNDICMVVADNILSHQDSVKEYVNFVTTDKRFNTEIEKIGDGMALSVYES